MKIAYESKKTVVINLERGEEIFSTLVPFLENRQTLGATITGLGAADRLEVAYYNLETKEYERHQFTEDVEILSLNGNLAFLEEKPVLHLHGVFGRRDLSTFGGHLFACRISGAGEIHLTLLDQKMTRAFDPVTGLNLLCQREIF